jgi:DNA-directed RNA polymerase subunit F
MARIEVLDEESISMSELKDELGKIKKRDEELNFRAQKTEEYLNQFVPLTKKDSKELRKKLEDMNLPRFRPQYINKLLDILPTDQELVKMALSNYNVTVSQDDLKKIASTVAEYAKKK